MVRLDVIAGDGRSPAERAAALDHARQQDDARALWTEIMAALREAEARLPDDDEECWASLDRAYAALDRYLDHLAAVGEIRPRCGPRCSTCCTDAPPIFAVEALRMGGVLHARPDGSARLARANKLAEHFRELLRGRGLELEPDITNPRYREAQLEWRALGHRCPILDDDGNCSAYSARPLACRVHVHVEDPARCDPQHPGFVTAERPPLWGHPREAEVELALARISERLGLGPPTNLILGLATTTLR